MPDTSADLRILSFSRGFLRGRDKAKFALSAREADGQSSLIFLIDSFHFSSYCSIRLALPLQQPLFGETVL